MVVQCGPQTLALSSMPVVMPIVSFYASSFSFDALVTTSTHALLSQSLPPNHLHRAQHSDKASAGALARGRHFLRHFAFYPGSASASCKWRAVERKGTWGSPCVRVGAGQDDYGTLGRLWAFLRLGFVPQCLGAIVVRAFAGFPADAPTPILGCSRDLFGGMEGQGRGGCPSSHICVCLCAVYTRVQCAGKDKP